MIIGEISYWIAIIILHIIIGFGPGFVIGLLLANGLGGREYQHHTEKRSIAVKEAAEHNAQWNPNHERWQR